MFELFDYGGLEIFDADIRSSGAISIFASGDLDDYIQFSVTSNIPLITGVGNYLALGKTGTAGSATSADDVFMGGALEVDGLLYADGGLFVEGGLILGATKLYINETSNANMTIGLTINQGASDNEILALKSSDVAHGMTTVAETDTYSLFQKSTGVGGGLSLKAISDSNHTASNPTLLFTAHSGIAADTTKSTAGRALVELYASLISGTGEAAVTADGNIFGIRGNTVNTVFLVDEDGDTWQSGDTTYEAGKGIKMTTNAVVTALYTSGNFVILNSPTSTLKFNSGISTGINCFENSGTGMVFSVGANVATSGATLKDSASIWMTANYWTGAASQYWYHKVLHDMITAGATPKSQVVYSTNDVTIMSLENDNGIASTINAGRVSYGDAASLTIATGVVAATKSYHEIVVEGGTGGGADALDTINGGIDGMMLVIRAATTGINDTITVTDNGNIALEGAVDFILNDVRDVLTLLYDTGQTKWLEISRSSNTA